MRLTELQNIDARIAAQCELIRRQALAAGVKVTTVTVVVEESLPPTSVNPKKNVVHRVKQLFIAVVFAFGPKKKTKKATATTRTGIKTDDIH